MTKKKGQKRTSERTCQSDRFVLVFLMFFSLKDHQTSKIHNKLRNLENEQISIVEKLAIR